MASIKNILIRFTSDTRRFRSDMKKTNNAISGVQKTVGKLGGIVASAFAVEKVIEFTSQAVRLAGELEGVKIAFNRLNNPRLLDDLRKATKGTVTDLELMKQAVRASNFKIPLEQLGSLFEFARRRAKETGESVDFLVQSIISGIGRKSPLILDNLGISAIELRKRFNGISIEAANVGDVARIVGDIATEEMQKMGKEAMTTADHMKRLDTSIENLKTAIGEKLAPTVSEYAEALTGVVESNSFEEFIRQAGLIVHGANAGAVAYKKQQDALRDQSKAFQQATTILNQYLNGQREIPEELQEQVDKVATLNKQYQSLKDNFADSTSIEVAQLKLQQAFADTQASIQKFVGDGKDAGTLAGSGGGGNGMTGAAVTVNVLKDRLKDLQKTLGDTPLTATNRIKELNNEISLLKKLIDAQTLDPSKIFGDVDEDDGFDESVLGFDERGLDDFSNWWDELAKINQDGWDKINEQSDKGREADSEADDKKRKSDLEAEQLFQQQREQVLFQFAGAYLTLLRELDETGRASALANILLNQAQAIAELVKQSQQFSPALAPFIFATGLAQITSGILQAKNVFDSAPRFAKGVIDLDGAGTGTSDSIPAWLSRGESIIRAKQTQRHKRELKAINDGRFDDEYVHKSDIYKLLPTSINANLSDRKIVRELKQGRKENAVNTALMIRSLNRSSKYSWK